MGKTWCWCKPEAPGIDLSTGAVVEGGREEDLPQVVALWSEELVEVILGTRNWLAVWQRLVTCGNHIFWYSGIHILRHRHFFAEK